MDPDQLATAKTMVPLSRTAVGGDARWQCATREPEGPPWLWGRRYQTRFFFRLSDKLAVAISRGNAIVGRVPTAWLLSKSAPIYYQILSSQVARTWVRRPQDDRGAPNSSHTAV